MKQSAHRMYSKSFHHTYLLGFTPRDPTAYCFNLVKASHNHRKSACAFCSFLCEKEAHCTSPSKQGSESIMQAVEFSAYS